MDIPMAVGVQQTRDRPMAACTQYLGDDLEVGAIHPSRWKMTKKQRMEQTDDCRYLARRLWSKGEYLLLSQASPANG